MPCRPYNGDTLVAELDAYGQVRAEYVWGSLGPVARIAGGRVQLYVCDALGHVRALIDAETGQITDRYDYDAWGNVVHNGSTRQPFVWNGAYGYEWIPEVSLYHVGARAYDPRTARWLQRDPAGAAGGHPNLYVYPRNDPINCIDPSGFRGRKKQASEEECHKILDKIENALNFLQEEMTKNEKYHPVQDLVGCPSKWGPGGHMAEIENRFIELDKYWRQLAEEDCYRFESIRIRGGRLGKLHNTIQQRVAQWASKLHQLGDKLLRQFINALQNPQVRKLVISLLRRLLTFVPVLGHFIKIILFIYDWHTGGFWNAVKGLVFQNNSHDMYYSKRGTILTCGGIPYEPSILLHRT